MLLLHFMRKYLCALLARVHASQDRVYRIHHNAGQRHTNLCCAGGATLGSLAGTLACLAKSSLPRASVIGGAAAAGTVAGLAYHRATFASLTTRVPTDTSRAVSSCQLPISRTQLNL